MHGPLAHGATVTDVASTKASIVARASALRLPFVGGHPMAGRESSGAGASTADLFIDRQWVVVPAEQAGERDIARVESLARAVGARPIRMQPDEHDRAVAAISHLPLVVAAALVEAVAGGSGWGTAQGLAATGWADMTRLAGGDAEMGAGILATNADAVAERLRDLRRVLDQWVAQLEGGDRATDAAALRRRLAAARALLEPGSNE
jgi:prephenate dehydrogenase